MRAARTWRQRVALLVIVTVALAVAGCTPSNYILTAWHGIKDLPDPNWPLTSNEVRAGVSALRWGIARIDGAISHLELAVADNPCDASAHAYLAIAYDMKRAESWTVWSQKRREAIGPAATSFNKFVPGAQEQMDKYAFERELAPMLSDLHSKERQLMARAEQLRRGGIVACRR